MNPPTEPTTCPTCQSKTVRVYYTAPLQYVCQACHHEWTSGPVIKIVSPRTDPTNQPEAAARGDDPIREVLEVFDGDTLVLTVVKIDGGIRIERGAAYMRVTAASWITRGLRELVHVDGHAIQRVTRSPDTAFLARLGEYFNRRYGFRQEHRVMTPT